MRKGVGGSDQAEGIRQALRELEPRGVTNRIPERVRRQVVAYVSEQRSAGRSWASVAQTVGLSATTLKRWTEDAHNCARPSAMVPVQVVGSRSEGQLALVTLGGMRVEGLALGDVLALLRALG